MPILEWLVSINVKKIIMSVSKTIINFWSNSDFMFLISRLNPDYADGINNKADILVLLDRKEEAI